MERRVRSKEVSRGPCEECGSSDAKVLFDDGHSFCFSHEEVYFNNQYEEDIDMELAHSLSDTPLPAPSVRGFFSAIKDRNIDKETCEKYGVRISTDASGKVLEHLYPYYDRNNSLLAYKVRKVETKEFSSQPAGALGRCTLFGEQLFKGGGKYITVCEGELDALAAYQMMGSKWPAVSIRDGAASAVRNCKNSYNFLNSLRTSFYASITMNTARRQRSKSLRSLSLTSAASWLCLSRMQATISRPTSKKSF